MSQQPDKTQQTEKPTPRQIKRAYEDGNLPRSMEVGQAVTLAIFLGWSFAFGGAFLVALMDRVRFSLARAGTASGNEMLVGSLRESTTGAFTLMVPLMAVLAVVSVGAQVAQTGFHPRKQPIPFEPKKLDPVKGLKNFITIDKVFQAVKAIVRVAAYAALAAFVVVPEWGRVASMSLGTPAQIFGEVAEIAGRVLLRALALGALLAAIDFGFTRYRWNKKLHMTKQQVKDDHKEQEGDPHIKAKRRERQREASRRRMIADVVKADVVVTNPTHVAVALKYDRITMAAPLVLAMGRGRIAKRIKEEAALHGIAVIEDPPLARLLLKVCRVGAPIPEALYRAVAEVMAYVMGRKKGVYRPLEPDLEPQGVGTADGGER